MNFKRFACVYTLAICIAALTIGCTKLPGSEGSQSISGGDPMISGPLGNGQGYGGGDMAFDFLKNAQTVLLRALREMPTNQVLGNSAGCNTSQEPLVCAPLLEAQDFSSVNAFVKETRESYIAFLERPAEEIFELSQYPPVVDGSPRDARTEIGPSGKIVFYRDGVLLLSPLSRILLLTHEIGHKVLHAGAYLGDANGGDKFLNLVGASVAWYARGIVCGKDMDRCLTEFDEELGRTGNTDLNPGMKDFRITFRLRTSSAGALAGNIVAVLGKRQFCHHAKFFDVMLDNHGKLYVVFDGWNAGRTPAEPQGVAGVNWVNLRGTQGLDDGQYHVVAIERKGLRYSIFIDGSRTPDAQFTASAVLDITPNANVPWRKRTNACSDLQTTPPTLPFAGDLDVLLYEYNTIH